jgi:hypothetical protein
MKLKYTLSMALLAIGSLLGFTGRREEVANEASTAGTHTNGIIPLIAEATLASRYLLVRPGAAADGIIVNIATQRPWGVCLDEPTYDASKVTKAAVALLGCAPGTVKMRANAAIAVGAPVYTAAAGKVSPTYGATLFLVGRAVTAAAADGDIIEVAHCFPMVNAAATL